MAGSLNEATLIGNVVKDPEIRTLNSGDRVANLRVATSESWKDKSGERKERSEFHSVVIFNENLVKVAEQYLKKGAKIFVRGSLQTRKYEQGGVEKYATEIVLQKFRGEIVMLGGKADASDDGDTRRGGTATGAPRESFTADLDDEIHFISRGLR